MNELLTQWSVDPNNVLAEYPRPQMERKSYFNLNGFWDYAISKTETEPFQYDGSILVPFSPESILSRVKRSPAADELMWYKRSFALPDRFNVGRVLINFGAVDQLCKVYLNGRLVGEHVGGYLPFSFDITEHLAPVNELVVLVRDETERRSLARGKQRQNPSGIWYTPQSGIWQTVWLESVPNTYITKLTITPRYDDSAVFVRVETNAPCDAIRVGVLKDGELLEAAVAKDGAASLPMPNFVSWTPDNPYLYDLVAVAGEDRVGSYFGMRKWSIGNDINNIPRMMLNNEPFFFNGLLDQGYWSDGMYTAPCDDALIYDIVMAKDLGFNTLRKHIKIEPLRWYYHCDRLGMVVWQDMVSGGGSYNPYYLYVRPRGGSLKDTRENRKKLSRTDPIGRQAYIDDMKSTVELLYNCVSLGVWGPFNEGWGQFDSARACSMLRRKDDTRIIDAASGWYDAGVKDLCSRHVYFKAYEFKPDRRHGRPVALTEFGGYSLTVGGHVFSDRSFGYKKFHTNQELTSAITALYCSEIIPSIENGLSACIYTQLADVEDEHNGLMTYDRRMLKIDANQLRTVMSKLKYKA